MYKFESAKGYSCKPLFREGTCSEKILKYTGILNSKTLCHKIVCDLKKYLKLFFTVTFGVTWKEMTEKLW